MTAQKESINVLHECIALQEKKSNDYQNPLSKIKQADYYPNGILTILDIIHAKKLRMDSVVAAIQNDKNYKPNFESLEDSAKDAINYLSFLVAYCRGKVDGQLSEHDFLNQPNAKTNTVPIPVLQRQWQGKLTRDYSSTDYPGLLFRYGDLVMVNKFEGEQCYCVTAREGVNLKIPTKILTWVE